MQFKGCDMTTCKGYCCYDGVYLKDGEEDKIKSWMNQYREDFSHSIEECFTDGQWKDKVSGRKTSVRDFKHGNDFPKHFNDTMCIFADENGLCELQKSAIKRHFNEWEIKPRACCIFPLTETNRVLEEPPLSNEFDIYNTGNDYKGYASCLPCTQQIEGSKKCSEVFEKEYNYAKGNLYDDSRCARIRRRERL